MSTPPIPPSTTKISTLDKDTVVIEKAGERYELKAISIEGQDTAQAIQEFIKWAKIGSNLDSMLGKLNEKLEEKSISVLKFDAAAQKIETGTIAPGNETLMHGAIASHRFTKDLFDNLNFYFSWSPLLTPPLSSASTATTSTGTAATDVIKKNKEKRLRPGIPNPNIACYRIASLQSLFSSPSFRAGLKTPISIGPDARQRDQIREELLQFTEMMEDYRFGPDALSIQEQYIKDLILQFSIDIEDPLTSGLSHPSQLQQLDANDYIEFILTKVLGQANSYTKEVVGSLKTSRLKRRDITAAMAPPPDSSVLSINFKGKKGQTLSQLVSQSYGWEHIQNEPGQMTKIEETVTDGTTGLPKKVTHAFAEYEQHIQIKGPPPPMLAIRMERGVYDPARKHLRMDETSIKIPDPDALGYYLVDMSAAYGKEKNTQRYFVNSFIERVPGRKGSETEQGHFISYIQQGTQWMKCDDGLVTMVSQQEVKKKMATAYLFCLEKYVPFSERGILGL